MPINSLFVIGYLQSTMDDRLPRTRIHSFATGRWIALVVAVFVGFETPASAQIRTTPRVPLYGLKAADYVAVTYIPPFPDDAGKSGSSRAATFDVRFSSNFPAAAREAFRFAAEVWGRYLDSEEPIVVDAQWTDLDEGTLGSAGPLLVGNFAGAEFRNAWYPSALAGSIVGSDVSPNQPDIFASFNSSFPSWYFGTDGRVPSDRYDFVTVILHELAHGLGFSGSFNVDDGDASNGDECPDAPAGWGCWGIAASGGTTLFPLVYDLFTEDGRDISLLVESVYPNPSTDLAEVLTSGAVFFDGDFSTTVNEDVPIDLYAPTSFDAGSSYSHLDESRFATPPGGSADPDALMTPFLARGEAIHNPGLVTCAIFEDFGWGMGQGCRTLLATSVIRPHEPGPGKLSPVSAFYPNPAFGEVTAVVDVATPQVVMVEVFDATGRRVARQRQHVEASKSNRLILDAGEWSPGVYFVRILGDTFRSTHSIVVSGR